jgi:hypothetical protein
MMIRGRRQPFQNERCAQSGRLLLVHADEHTQPGLGGAKSGQPMKTAPAANEFDVLSVDGRRGLPVEAAGALERDGSRGL